MTKYRSKFEQSFAKKFTDLAYEPTSIPYWSAHTYTPDFVSPSGRYWFELKGFFRRGEPKKYVDVSRQLHFDRPDDINHVPKLVFVFMNPDKKMPGARRRKDGTYYTMKDWADKHKFLWCTADTVKRNWLI